MRTTLLALVALLLWIAPAGAKPPGSLLGNPSFEAAVPGSPGQGVGQRRWTLGPDKLVPDGWSLNLAYPGTLEVVTEPVSSGDRAVRISAPAKRDAHIFRRCPALRPGAWYRISARVHGGPALLMVYEYATGRKVLTHVLQSASAPRDGWRTFTGFYAPTVAKFEHASIALGVPHGGAATFDDVVVEKLESEPPDPDARPLVLENDVVTLTVSAGGRLISLKERKSGTERAVPDAPISILTAVRGGVEIPVSRLEKRGGGWVARFADPRVSVKLRVKKKPAYFLFEITEAKPRDLERVELRFPVKPLRTRDSWMPGSYDDAFGITHMGVTPNTEVALARDAGLVAPEARWHARHGIRGGRSVLLATPFGDFLESIRRMEVELGLPSPMLHSGAPGQTGAQEWARLSTAARRSYLFATYLVPAHLDAIIAAAKLGGFGLIMLHRKTWRASGGHEAIASGNFPGGLPDLAAACAKIHAAGLGVGLHLFGPAVSLNDAYAQPVPDKRLFSIDVAKLAGRIGREATELLLDAPPPLPRHAAPDLYPGDLLRIGDEIVRWREWIPGSPTRVLGCERGALGTRRSAHAKGAAVTSLIRRNGGLLVDPDSTLPAEMGAHLARVVNACRADLVYFDACQGAPAGQQPTAWYYLNKVLLASCAKFDHGVLVQTGMGPGRQLAWHLVPRSASADGHGDLKGYLDQRMPAVRQFRKTYVAADIGWYALDVHGKPDELEYVCARTLGGDASISVQAHIPLLDRHPRAREVFEMIERWERRRLAGDVPAELRRGMLVKGRDVKLLEDADTWSLWDADYEPARPIAVVNAEAGTWPITNARKEPARVALEIQRQAIATTPAEHAGSQALPVADFDDLTAYGDESDPRLRTYILRGEMGLSAVGFARRGVTSTLSPTAAAPRGLRAVRFALESKVNGAGWAFTGRRFRKPRDLSKAAALGLWVQGDGHGETLAIALLDSAGKAGWFRVALDYTGWRFQSFPRIGQRDTNWSQIEYLLLGLEHVPPQASVAVGVAALRALPTLHVPREWQGLSVHIGERRLHIPVALAPDQCLTVDPLGRVVHWPGGLRAGRPVKIEGGALILKPGTQRIGIALDDPVDYAGDLTVRVCRTRPLGSGKR